jgi:hypothetical protein
LNVAKSKQVSTEGHGFSRAIICTSSYGFSRRGTLFPSPKSFYAVIKRCPQGLKALIYGLLLRHG